MPETGKEFGFHGAVEGVVDALVDCRLNPVVGTADFADLSDFPGHVVADGEVGEEALLVQLVDFAEGVDEGGGAIWAWERMLML